MILSIIAIFCLILFNSFLALAEVSIIASRKRKLKELAQKGVIGAKKAEKLAQKPEVFLSTMQVGITTINILIGIYSESEIQSNIEVFFSKLGLTQEHSIMISYFLVVIVITYFTVLGEIVAKRIGMLHPENTASTISYAIYYIFVKTLYPFVYVLTISTRLVLKILKIKEADEHMSIDELKLAIRQAGNSGALRKTEYEMINKMINISNTQVGAIMTPRNKLSYIDLQDSVEVNLNKLKECNFSYFPVINGSLNNLIGIISVKNLFATDNVTNESIALSAKDSELVYIPEFAKLSRLIDIFKEKKSRIAIVLDEYGEIEGIATLNDILKTVVGELAIANEGQRLESVKYDKDGSLIVEGNILIQEVKELLKIHKLSDYDNRYRTLASFILKQCNGLPTIGQNFRAAGWSFKVIELDKFRIAKVSISREKKN